MKFNIKKHRATLIDSKVITIDNNKPYGRSYGELQIRLINNTYRVDFSNGYKYLGPSRYFSSYGELKSYINKFKSRAKTIA